MKYIVTKTPDDLEEIFLFSDTINHDCMTEVLQGIRNQTHDNWERIRREPVSAGFVVGNECVGESISLHLKSRPEEDTALLRKNQNTMFN